MKSELYQKRFYRDWSKEKGLHSAQIITKETDLEIFSDKPIDLEFVQEKIADYRRDIENYIAKDRRFLVALKPIEVELQAPLIVKEMARQARFVNVGPMAGVAGAIAQFLGKDILKRGAKEAIVENGGDLFLKIKKSRQVGIYAGRSKFSGRISFKIDPKDTPLGIATSSGTIGHSLSFGNADAVVILHRDAILADALATATANLVQAKEDFAKAIDFAKNIPGILGVLIILKNNLASWGKIELIKRP